MSYFLKEDNFLGIRITRAKSSSEKMSKKKSRLQSSSKAAQRMKKQYRASQMAKKSGESQLPRVRSDYDPCAPCSDGVVRLDRSKSRIPRAGFGI